MTRWGPVPAASACSRGAFCAAQQQHGRRRRLGRSEADFQNAEGGGGLRFADGDGGGGSGRRGRRAAPVVVRLRSPCGSGRRAAPVARGSDRLGSLRLWWRAGNRAARPAGTDKSGCRHRGVEKAPVVHTPPPKRTELEPNSNRVRTAPPQTNRVRTELEPLPPKRTEFEPS